MNKLIVFLYIDALDYKFINPDNTPFLSSLIKKFTYRKIENVFGYSFAIQSSMLSGKYPDVTNLWMPYYYSPGKSPLLFKFLKKIEFLLPLNHFPFLNSLLLLFLRKFFLKKGVHVNNIPYKMIDKISLYPYYYISELPYYKNLQNLFMEKNQIVLTYIGPPKIKNNYYNNLLDYLTTSKIKRQMVIVYDDLLDGLGHKFGPNSDQYLNYVKYLDKILIYLYKKIKIINNQFVFIIFSDHSQCETKHTLDIISELNKMNIKFIKDYICFVDATIALFWPKNKKVAKKLIEKLRKYNKGKILDEKIKKKYHISFKDRRYGDIIFSLNPGYIFFPNFFSSFNAFKGLHGYPPEEEVQSAFLISNKKIPSYVDHITDIKNFLLHISNQ